MKPQSKQEKAIFATIILGLILMILACFLARILPSIFRATYIIGALLLGVGFVAALLAIPRQSRRDNGEQ